MIIVCECEVAQFRNELIVHKVGEALQSATCFLLFSEAAAGENAGDDFLEFPHLVNGVDV